MPLSISQGDVWEVYHDIASYLLQTTSENVVGKTKGRSPRKVMAPNSAKSGVHRTSSQPLLPSSQPQPRIPLTRGTRALSAGTVTRRLRTRVSHRGVPHISGLKEPGENIIMSLLATECHMHGKECLLIHACTYTCTVCTCTYTM